MSLQDRGYHREWQEFLAESGQAGEADIAAYSQRMRRDRPHYVPLAYPTPAFDANQLASLGQVALCFRDLITSLPAWLFGGDNDAWLQAQGRPPSEQAFLSQFLTPRLLHIAQQFSRPDFLVGEHGSYLVEVNFGSAIGGLALLDQAAAAFSGSTFQAYLTSKRGYQTTQPLTMPAWHAALLPLLRLPAGRGVFFVALADPDEVTHPRGHILDFVDAVRAYGHDVRLGLLQSLRADERGVHFEGLPVSTVYAMCTYREMVQHQVPETLLLLLVKLDMQERVDFIGSPANVLYDNKVNLALLSEAATSGRLPAQARALVRRHLPTTCLLTPATAAKAAAAPHEWVLKPTDDSGGAQVIAGDAVTHGAWSNALNRALDSSPAVTHVLQQRIFPLWTWHDGTQSLAFCLSPIVLGARLGGCLLRQAPHRGNTPIINVAQGGAAGLAIGLRAAITQQASCLP